MNGMQITAKVSDQRYDLGAKYQGQIYFKSALQLVTHFPFIFLTNGFIVSSMSTCVVYTLMKVSGR